MGEVLVELADRVAAPQKISGAEVHIPNPPYRVNMAAVDLVDLRRQIVSIFRLRPSFVMRSFSPRPKGDSKLTGLDDC
jgi:hypothetical protein